MKVVEVAEPVVEVAEPVVEAAVPVVEAAEPVVEAAKPVVEAAAAAKAKTNQNKPVPNGDGSCPTYKPLTREQHWAYPPPERTPLPRTTGFGKLIDDWIAGDQSRIKVVAKYGKIENWNTKFVTNLKCAFKGMSSFNADISKWDVSNVTTLEQSKSFLANC